MFCIACKWTHLCLFFLSFQFDYLYFNQLTERMRHPHGERFIFFSARKIFLVKTCKRSLWMSGSLRERVVFVSLTTSLVASKLQWRQSRVGKLHVQFSFLVWQKFVIQILVSTKKIERVWCYWWKHRFFSCTAFIKASLLALVSNKFTRLYITSLKFNFEDRLKCAFKASDFFEAFYMKSFKI